MSCAGCGGSGVEKSRVGFPRPCIFCGGAPRHYTATPAGRFDQVMFLHRKRFITKKQARQLLLFPEE